MSLRITSSKSNQRRQLMSGHRGSSADYVTRRRFLHKLGAVGNAQWTGVPLGAVLERAGLRDSAVEVVLEGADSGEIAAETKPAGVVAFARSLPLAKAQAPEVLLAYQMNGVDLPPAHGF